MKPIERLIHIIPFIVLILSPHLNVLNAQVNDNQNPKSIDISTKTNSNYTKLSDLQSITDRNPEIYKVIGMRIGKPTDYWFNMALKMQIENLDIRLPIKIDYIRYSTRTKVASKNDRISQFDVFLNYNGLIDSITTINHGIDAVTKESIIAILKKCQWKPALSNLKPVDVNFILEIKFSDL